MCREKMHLISFNDLTLQRVVENPPHFTKQMVASTLCYHVTAPDTPSPMVLSTHFWTICGSFPHTVQATYTFCKIVWSHLPGTLQRVGRKGTSFHLLTYGRSHTLFNNLRIFSTHGTHHLSQHSIIICLRYIFVQNEVCWDC